MTGTGDARRNGAVARDDWAAAGLPSGHAPAAVPMHAAERDAVILAALGERGFVFYRALEDLLRASPATIRRDLARLAEAGKIVRVHGGARLDGASGADIAPSSQPASALTLAGTPFDRAIRRFAAQKRAIGRAAASLCRPGEGVMIDGGTTTFQMCPHLDGLQLQVLTNSLPIVAALLPQSTTRVLVPAGSVFREQNIILAPAGEESMPRFHAPKLFMGAAALGRQGVMQADAILVAAERRLIERADEIILCIDSSKFATSSGAVVCDLEDVDVVITDDGISDASVRMLERAGVRLIVAARDS